MLKGEESEANAEETCCARRGRKRNVAKNEQRLRRDVDEDGGGNPKDVNRFDHRPRRSSTSLLSRQSDSVATSLSVQSSRYEISQMRTALANSSSPHS